MGDTALPEADSARVFGWPDNMKFRKIMTEKVEDVSLALFLPLFFVSTGLRTELGLLDSPELWTMCGIFILVAIIGKFGGT